MLVEFVGGLGSLAASQLAVLLCPTIYSIKNGLKYIFEPPNVHRMFSAASGTTSSVPIPNMFGFFNEMNKMIRGLLKPQPKFKIQSSKSGGRPAGRYPRKHRRIAAESNETHIFEGPYLWIVS